VKFDDPSRNVFFYLGLLVSACGSSAPTASTQIVPTTAEPSDRRAAETARPSGAVGDFTLRDVDGRTHSLSDYLGEHIVVISYFAMWCEPCKKELVHLDALYRTHRDKGLAVLAVSMDEPETQGEVRPFVKGRGFAFPVVLDTEGVAAELFNPRRDAPFNLIIDRREFVVWSKTGYTPGDEKQLERAVLSAIEASDVPR
jgi:peroxiredoxin